MAEHEEKMEPLEFFLLFFFSLSDITLGISVEESLPVESDFVNNSPVNFLALSRCFSSLLFPLFHYFFFILFSVEYFLGIRFQVLNFFLYMNLIYIINVRRSMDIFEFLTNLVCSFKVFKENILRLVFV